MRRSIMKIRRKLLMSLVLVLIASSLMGCAQKAEAPVNSESGKLELKQISIGGAGTSGTFYIMAAGFSDVINKKLVINHQPMIDEFNYVKKSIMKTSASHAGPLRVYIFNFKVKWDKIYGKAASGIYFSDLMAIYKMQMEKTGIMNYEPEDCNAWQGYEAFI